MVHPGVAGIPSEPFGTTLNFGESLSVTLFTISGEVSLSLHFGPAILSVALEFYLDAVALSVLVGTGAIDIPVTAGSQTVLGPTKTFRSVSFS